LELQKIQNDSLQAQADEDQRALDEAEARRLQALADLEGHFNDSLNRQNSAVAEQQRDIRKLRNDGLITEEEFAEKSLDIQKQKLAEEIQLRKAFGKETFALESQLLDLEKQRADKELEDKKAQDAETIEQFKEVANTIAEIAFQAQEAQIANIDQLIDDAQGRIDTLNDALNATKGQRSQLDADIATSEENARKARGTNSKEIKEQLDAQRKQRVELIKLEKKQAAERAKAEEEQAALEEEKAERERKLAKQQAGLAIATAVVESAPTLVKALSLPFPASLVSFATVSAMIAGVIGQAKAATSKLRKGGIVKGASHAQGGVRGTGSFNDIEVEGNEFVINKEATKNNIGLIESINKYGATKKFADGGLIPNANASATAQESSEVSEIARSVSELAKRPNLVSVVDIQAGINRVNTIDDSSQIG
jgi:hypothetical protein